MSVLVHHPLRWKGGEVKLVVHPRAHLFLNCEAISHYFGCFPPKAERATVVLSRVTATVGRCVTSKRLTVLQRGMKRSARLPPDWQALRWRGRSDFMVGCGEVDVEVWSLCL